MNVKNFYPITAKSVTKMKDIDNSYGQRIISKNGCIKFFGDVYCHPKLKDFIGFPVIVKGYGYSAIDVFLIERKTSKNYGKGQFICMIELNH